MTSFKYKMGLSYDGTGYSGWQVQPNARSIQTLLQAALSTFLRTPTSVVGAGRTDAGVHALEQIAHFSSPSILDEKKFLRSINGLLPYDIRVHLVEPVPDDFHACYSAKGKIYRYHLHTAFVFNPFKRLYCYHFPIPINTQKLVEATPFLVGKRDFTSFSNEAHKGSASRNPIRTLRRLSVIETEGGLYLEFEGDGFLYKMVRNLVGTLLQIAQGKLPLEALPALLEAKDRKKAAAAAPAHGLFLVKVLY